MNLPCDVKVQFTKSLRDTNVFRKNTEVAVLQDEFGHLVLYVGPRERKQTFPLERNIANVYDAFVKEGKSSVALKTPEVNIFIQNATVAHLTLFAQLLKDIQQYPYLDIEVYAEQKKLPKRSETMEGRPVRGRPKKRKTDDGDDTAMDGDLDPQDDATGAKGQQMAKSLLGQQQSGAAGQQPEEEPDDDLDGFIVDEEESSEQDDSDQVDEEEEMERRERQMRKNKKKRERQGSDSSEDEKEEDSVPSEEM